MFKEESKMKILYWKKNYDLNLKKKVENIPLHEDIYDSSDKKTIKQNKYIFCFIWIGRKVFTGGRTLRGRFKSARVAVIN